MKVLLSPNTHYTVSNVKVNNVKPVSSPYRQSLRSVDTISFGNSAPAVKQLFVGAEIESFIKAGGVATVMGDYKALEQPMVIPYYNGDVIYNPETGKPTGEVRPWEKDGKPIFTAQDLDAKSIEDVKQKAGDYVELEEVASKTMSWGKEEKSPITLYKVKNNEKFKNLYLVYTDVTAKMRKPYDSASGYYSSEGGAPITKGWDGDPYAKFDKAVVEFMDKFGIKEGTVVCSDAQSAYVPHYMAERALANDPIVERLKPSYIAHNLGDGYQGDTSARNMLVNLGVTKEQIDLIEHDEAYIEALKNGTEEEYLKKLVPETIDAKNNPNPIKLIMNQRRDGYIVGFDTVSEEYSQAIANNPRMAKAIQAEYLELWKSGKAGGILNALNNPALGYDKPPLLPGYVKPVTLDNGEVIEPMKTFPTDATADEVRKIKLENKKNLFNRLSGKYTDNMVLTGVANKKAELIGTIDPKWIEKINAGEQVDLFISCGRGDFQKAFDTVLDSFEIFGKTPEGKNAVLVFGGELPSDSKETERILSRLKLLLSDERFKGRVCCMDGFAPWVPMSSAGDMAILPSRFAPCELTDLEAIKYLCTPNVTNTQGLRQKNYDPRDAVNGDIATSYRTKTEFFSSVDEAKKFDSKLNNLYEKLLEKEMTKLKLHGVNEDKIKALAEQSVLESKKFTDALRESIDARIAQELADNMVEFKRRDQGLVCKMLENQKNIKTKWWDNGALHPSGKSTGELYQTKHFEPASQKPKKSFFNFLENFNKIERESSVTGNVLEDLSVDDIAAQFKKSKQYKSLMKKHYILAAGAAVVSFAAGAFLYKYNQKNTSSTAKKPLNTTVNTALTQKNISMSGSTLKLPAFMQK